jgi:crotonobetainyl-CoA:carnitine CoA-transferase CaiB-like acyl-CoA transferase
MADGSSARPAGGSAVDGLRVIEYGEGISCAFGAKILADLGADVVKVEPLGGDPLRRRGPFRGDQPNPEASGIFLYLNANKRGVALDLRRREGRTAFGGLLQGADVLIHNVAPACRAELGLASAELTRAYPALVVAAISPFGDRGPHAGYRAHELTLANASGWAFLSPGASPHPELPPLKAFGSQHGMQGGLHASLTAMAALLSRRATGKGQAIEVSEQECVAAMLEMNFMHWSYAGRETSRCGNRLVGPWFILDCADGQCFLVCVEEHQWKALVEFMGNPEWAKEEIFKDRLARGANQDALFALMSEWASTWKVQDLFREGQKRRIPFAAVNRMGEIYADEQLANRGFFVDVTHPVAGRYRMPSVPFRSQAGRYMLRRPAPRLSEHDADLRGAGAARPVARDASRSEPAAKRPLDGVRVLDFTWAWAGPFATLQLAHLGAEVIRLETAKRACVTRSIPPFADDQPGPNRAGYFNQYNQGKRSVTLDIRSPEAAEIVKRLVKISDVVVENFAAGVMQRMGFGYGALRAIKPDIIMLSISGYGQAGPYSGYIAYGPPAGALSGFFATTGYEGMPPAEIGISYADPNAGIWAANLVLAALLHRAETGEGQYVDLSQWEAALMMMGEGLMEHAMNGRTPERIGDHDPQLAPHNTYKALGDQEKWVGISVADEEEWRALCSVIGDAALADDPRFATMALRKQNEAALDEMITRWTSTRDRWQTTRALQKAGVAAYPALSNKDLAESEHLHERGFLVALEHPEVGKRIHAGVPWTMSGTPTKVRAPAPLRGADTDSVLRDLLGYSQDEIERLRAGGVLS